MSFDDCCGGGSGMARECVKNDVIMGSTTYRDEIWPVLYVNKASRFDCGAD